MAAAIRTAPLCWGQHHHVLRYLHAPEASRHEAHITTSYPLPEGCTTTHVRAALNHLVRRHEGLRTVYDLYARPWPRQLVQPFAPLPLIEADTADDPVRTVRELYQAPFDLAREWPLRACAVTSGGRLLRLHLVFNHLAFDDVALDRLSGELDALLAARVAGRPVSLPPVVHQPVDLARREQATDPEEALAHWRRTVRELPADVYARRRTRPAAPDAAHSAALTTPALLGAARDIAARAGVWPSAVHVAAFAVTLAAYTGERRIAHRIYTSQREAGGSASVMTCQSYPTPVLLDLTDDPPFGEVLRRAAERIEASIAHAHVPFDQVEEAVARESARRGQRMRVVSELNFLDNRPRSCGTRRDRLTWNPAPADWARAGSDLYFRVYEWSDGITLALQVLDAVMDRDAAARFLRGYATLLHAHRDGTADLRVSRAAGLPAFPPPPARRLVRIGTDLVDLDATEAALREHEAVTAARVTAGHDGRREGDEGDEGDEGPGLTAEVTAGRPVTAAELRTHLLGAVHDHPAARCPAAFRITVSAATATAAGGIPAPPAPSPTAAERALTAAVAEANGLDPDRVDPGAGYAAAGGRVLRLPRVLAALAEHGWAGVSPRRLNSARPLRTLARRMRPTTTENSGSAR
ncbi:condensation domain-containing protein [Streptomyces sp. YIM 98790]|uniref:condensation domain-containing protein n=1 Tax=Streptomyces sp. YIM 98790 TaxID=2689077 RepID=UPI00140A579D|nr:condensation domain-containing protein [Streptomyces sp. YIM 98790]